MRYQSIIASIKFSIEAFKEVDRILICKSPSTKFLAQLMSNLDHGLCFSEINLDFKLNSFEQFYKQKVKTLINFNLVYISFLNILSISNRLLPFKMYVSLGDETVVY